MINYQDRWAVVTGASSGLGRGFAGRLAEQGMSVVLTGLNEARLDEAAHQIRSAAPVKIETVAADLSTPSGVSALLDHVGDRPIEVLVNNAGFGSYGRFDEADPDREADEVAVDVSAVVALARAFLPGMLARRSGGILNVASTIAFQPAPYQAVYGASKAFVLSFSQALWAEARSAGVAVTALCPGPTRTGFVDALGADVGHTAIYRRLGDSEPVIESGLRALDRGRAVVVPGIRNKLIAASGRFMPREWLARVSARLLRPGNVAVRPPIEVCNEIVVHSSAERVWDLLTDVEGWPSWYQACRWVRLEAADTTESAGDATRATSFRWKAHPIALRSTVVARERPRSFAFVADAKGVHAERTFAVRPSPDVLNTVVVSHETQVGLLPWLGRLYLARRLHRANQAFFDDLARAVHSSAATRATPARAHERRGDAGDTRSSTRHQDGGSMKLQVGSQLPQAGPRVARGGTLILGGGFGGAYVARCLGKSATIVTPESSMLYTPLLPEVAAGAIEPRHVAVPLRMMCPHADLLLGRAEALDEDARVVTVKTDAGELEVEYENLVVALGAVASWLPISGLVQHAVGFKNLGDAVHLRNHVLRKLDSASVDLENAERHLSFVFVGAGYAGVEVLAEVRDLVEDALRHHPDLRDVEQRWVLVDLAPKILSEVPGGIGDYAARQLVRRGVELRLSTTLTSVEERAVTLSDGARIETETVVWTAGVKPNGALAPLGLPLDRRGRVVVDSSLRVEGRAHVWALGDCAAVPNQATPDRTDPPTCQHALRQARHLAKNLRGASKPYRYRSIGQGATLGRDKGIANLLGIVNFKGTVGSIVTRWYHLRQIPIFSRRLRVLTDGALSFVFGRDMAELGVLERSGATTRATTDRLAS